MSASSNTPSGDPEPVDAEFEPADPQSDPEPSTAKPKTGGLGLGGALVVLLLAGVISAGVSYGVTRYVPLEGAAPDYTDENALAAIRDIIANNGPVTDFDASELEAQLSAHAADIAELQAMSEAVANLDAQIASLRVSQSSEEGAPSAQPSFDPQALASLSQDIQDVRTQLEQNTAADQQRLAELQGVITRVSTLSNNQQADDVSDRVS